MQTLDIPTNRPRVTLAGRSPYAALALCMGAARRAGWSEAQIRAFRRLATSGSVEGVLQACGEWFEAR